MMQHYLSLISCPAENPQKYKTPAHSPAPHKPPGPPPESTLQRQKEFNPQLLLHHLTVECKLFSTESKAIHKPVLRWACVLPFLITNKKITTHVNQNSLIQVCLAHSYLGPCSPPKSAWKDYSLSWCNPPYGSSSLTAASQFVSDFIPHCTGLADKPESVSMESGIKIFFASGLCA